MAGIRPINLATGKKVYFASDQHFGAPTPQDSRPREEKFVRFLNQIKTDAQVLFLMGDLFDFWHEWQTVVPKGFVRVLGKLAELKDAGIDIYFFVGNHDLWMKDYLETEIGIPVFFEPQNCLIDGQTFFLAHGDGLGPGDKSYKIMKKVFLNPLCKWLFRWIHPDWSMKLATYLSVKNKLISGDEDVKFLGEDREFLILYAKEILTQQTVDYFVFGHRHLPMVLPLNEQAQYVNLGDWIQYFSYVEFNNSTLNLLYFEK
jgi:UDP-2,3-diacylglucosamine hydrolase